MLSNYVLLGEGDYSDRRAALFKVLKPFTLAEALAEFDTRPVVKDEYGHYNRLENFKAFLCKEGYLEDAEVNEVHVGSFGEIEISSEESQIQFNPSGE